MPVRLRHPALGYLAAVLLEVIAVALTLLLLMMGMPTFSLLGLLVPMQMGETLIGMLSLDGGAREKAYLYPNKVAITRDIARLGTLVLEHERLLRDRAEAQANELALREAQAQMDTFLGMAGHEMKTPLTGIKLDLQLTQRRLGNSARRRRSCCSNLRTPAIR